MPIKIPDALPATAILESENIFVMTEYRALHQDIRPLKVLILNLMPTKIVTETQILRKLSNTPVQIQVELLRTASYQSQHTDEDHLASFYTTFDQVRDRNFDGMIITGAPVGKSGVQPGGLLAGAVRNYGVEPHPRPLHPPHLLGAQAGCTFIMASRSAPAQEALRCVRAPGAQAQFPPVRGFDDVFCAPHSRYTEVWRRIFAPHRSWSCWPPPLRQESTLSRRRTAASSSSWDTQV